MKIRYTVLACIFISCRSGVNPISNRNLSEFERNDEPRYIRRGRPEINKKKEAPELFIRKPEIKIIHKDKVNTNGSLFRPDDVRQDFFSTYNRPSLGSYLNIKIVNHNQLPVKRGEDNQKNTDSASSSDNPDKASEPGKELEEDKLIRSLPHLEPASYDAEAILDMLKMRVVHQYENGDLLLSWQRESIGSEDARTQEVQARLPYRNLNPSSELTTQDLTDIILTEHYKDETLQKKATGWQDEYTLRISGFDEAKSKIAADLESKRRDLMDMNQQIKNRLKSMGSERRQWTQERDSWIKKREEDRIAMEKIKKDQEAQNSLIEEQKSTIKDQNKQIKDQQTQIEELSRPEEKPSDGA
ncbi:MAG: hypothetical protein H6618_00480 [Deltaproteobacteria bacterium]|nr:hypothetical protein [Deltaproteobacteria bacterium]